MSAEQDVDRVVYEAFFASVGGKGVLVEVGAAGPDYLSIGRSYRGRSWKVISIEPNPDFCAAHRAAGNEVLEYACSDEDSEDRDFYVVNSHGAEYLGGTVTFESFSSLGIRGRFAEMHKSAKTDTRTISVKVRRLDTILAEHEPEIEEVDIVAVDVEGWELSVVRGINLARYRPKVVILENLFGAREYTTFMRRHGYFLWRRLKPNDVFVREDMKAIAPRRAFLEIAAGWKERLVNTAGAAKVRIVG